jgi:hypothetical protein
MLAEARYGERSEKMLEREMVHLGFGSVEDGFAGGAWEFSLLLVAQREARDALARAQEDAAIEVVGVLSQADEALVMG